MKIIRVTGRQILDSRGNPTVEAEVLLADGTLGRGASPSGASTGAYEAHELRDGDKKQFGGKGVSKAVAAINTHIAKAICGMDADDLYAVDAAMCHADGTENKSKFGANAILAVSIACVQAAAASHGMPLFRYLGGVSGRVMPIPMMNILNGGAHAANNLDVQEFMIMPVGACCFSEGLRWCTEVYHCLAALLRERGCTTAVGDEGGFAPDLADDEAAIGLILEAIARAGYRAGEDFRIALDAAASEWKKDKKAAYYVMPKSGKQFSTDALIAHWTMLVEKYPIISIEDALDEEDWDGWRKLTATLGGRIQLVGDDLFVTNTDRLERGIAEHSGNAILIKPNQIGTISETLDAIRTARRSGFATVISHRSGETEDTTIADLAVALNAGQIKTGAPCRTERTAKYNRLLRIEELVGGCCCNS